MATDRVEKDLDRGFQETVHPFLETYCFGCHGAEKQKGKLDLRIYSSRQVIAKDYRAWETVLEKLAKSEMPPEEAKRQPPSELRQKVIGWIRSMRQQEARRQAGDPGPVLAHRLSNAEYDFTIRDLTGVDLRPAREFPVDPANEAGFDNSGESLAMSPALFNKFFEAARQVSEHLVLKPDGFTFAPHSVVTESDRDKYCVKRIVDFYQRQSTNYTDYFLAAWRFRHRTALGLPRQNLHDCAMTNQVSPKYLATLWSVLTGPREPDGALAALQSAWEQLPTPHRHQFDLARPECAKMCDLVMALRQKYIPEVTNLEVRGIAPGSQSLVLWKDRQLALNRRRAADSASAPSKETSHDQKNEKAVERFCQIFPDAFYVSERVLIFLKEDKDSHGRLLSAGFHLMTGYYRDDAPLSDLILDGPGRAELDTLWEEFHFVTLDWIRQYKDFIFFERAEPPRFMQGAEFDFARSEDKDAASAARIHQLAQAYLAKARRNGGSEIALQAIDDYFKTISADIRRLEQSRQKAEPSHLRALTAFAERAYRRPLQPGERDELLAFYAALRTKDGLDHEEAMRDTLVSILMSPYFCYRGLPDEQEDQSRTASSDSTGRGEQTLPPPTRNSAAMAGPWKTKPLSEYSLASRLSYFLWSSLPDMELLDCARAGTLHRPAVLRAQAKRMLQEDRVRGLVTEFGAHWLDFRRFEEHNAVDRARFPSFNNELRAAMFEEPVQFFLDVIWRNRSILDFLYANDTFVNATLARHYGMPVAGSSGQENRDQAIDTASRNDRAGRMPGRMPALPGDDWVRIEQADRYGRGGLLPMSVFLTMNAPGLRTSPVKRGYWVVRRLLGEQIPPPPPNVPELPADEQKLGDLTLRDLLARHRQDPSCAGCHARFDAVGLAFEGYGPIGERRAVDLGGRPVDTQAAFPGGRAGIGLEGLRRYLHETREQEFLDNFCRKLLAYALGRSLVLADDVLLGKMRARLAAQSNRFESLVETIVTSPQFLMRRDFAMPLNP